MLAVWTAGRTPSGGCWCAGRRYAEALDEPSSARIALRRLTVTLPGQPYGIGVGLRDPFGKPPVLAQTKQS